MSYKAIYESQFEKSVKKLKKQPQLVEEIKQICQEILENPIEQQASTSLTGNWSGFVSYHFHRSPEYRLIYRVYACSNSEKKENEEIHFCQLEEHTECENPKECKGMVSFLFVNTREVFNRIYKLPKKEVNKYLYEL